MNFTKQTTNNRLFLAILFSFLAVVGSGSVAVGDFVVAPNSAGIFDDAAGFADEITNLNKLTDGADAVMPGKSPLSALQSASY